MTESRLLIFGWVLMISMNSCVSTYYQGEDACKEVHWPFVTVSYDENGQKKSREVAIGTGGNRNVKFTQYYPSGEKQKEGRVKYRKRSECLSSMSNSGKHKYWDVNGSLVWTETHKKDTVINPVPDNILKLLDLQTK